MRPNVEYKPISKDYASHGLNIEYGPTSTMTAHRSEYQRRKLLSACFIHEHLSKFVKYLKSFAIFVLSNTCLKVWPTLAHLYNKELPVKKTY
jgi:hypothetical protein